MMARADVFHLMWDCFFLGAIAAMIPCGIAIERLRARLATASEPGQDRSSMDRPATFRGMTDMPDGASVAGLSLMTFDGAHHSFVLTDRDLWRLLLRIVAVIPGPNGAAFRAFVGNGRSWDEELRARRGAGLDAQSAVTP